MNDYSSHDGLSLAGLVRSGAVSPRELVTAAIERIQALNPRLNAVVHTMFDSALKQADAPLGDGQFHGVPFMLKDLLAWYAGVPITSGSRLYDGWIPPHDTELVKRYRRAGLIVVGKTNTPEFGLTPFTEPELFGPGIGARRTHFVNSRVLPSMRASFLPFGTPCEHALLLPSLPDFYS